MANSKEAYKLIKLKLALLTNVFNGLSVVINNRLIIQNRPLSHGGHFVSRDLKSFVYARLASFSLRAGQPGINKAF